LQALVPEFFGLFKQSRGAVVEEGLDEFIGGGMELGPEVVEVRLVKAAEGNSAAGSAEDVGEGVNVNAFCGEKCGFAVLFGELAQGL